MNSSEAYTPLMRMVYGPTGRHRLYLGANHLLDVHEEFFVERYRRFDLGDIQALICQRTNTREIITLLHLLAMIAVALLWSALFTYRVLLTLQVYLAGLFLMLLASAIVNQLRGPTCLCVLQTATGLHRLYAINRFRVADRVLARLQPLIESVQGRLDPATLSAAVLTQPASGTAAAVPPPVPVTRTVRHCSGRAHVALAVLLGVDLFAGLADLYRPMNEPLETAYGLLMLLSMFGVLLAALITQTGSDLPGTVKTLTWITVGFILLALATSGLAPVLWKQVDAAEVKYWGNIYSVCGETFLCLGFWRGLRGWR